jgi:hypothetical protein
MGWLDDNLHVLELQPPLLLDDDVSRRPAFSVRRPVVMLVVDGAEHKQLVIVAPVRVNSHDRVITVWDV